MYAMYKNINNYVFLYKYHNGLLPSVADSLFTNSGSSYNTRDAINYRFRMPKMKRYKLPF